jgi:hypothetical protein
MMKSGKACEETLEVPGRCETAKVFLEYGSQGIEAIQISA